MYEKNRLVLTLWEKQNKSNNSHDDDIRLFEPNIDDIQIQQSKLTIGRSAATIIEGKY